MTGRHAASGGSTRRSRASVLFGADARARMTDAVTALGGAGVAVTGTQLGGAAGAGLALAGVGLPSAWMAWGAGRTRRRLTEEQSARRRTAAMSAAQDGRIAALRQRLRAADVDRIGDRDQLAAAHTGLLTNRIELASVRSQLSATRGDLAAARAEIDLVREQLTALLAAHAEAAAADGEHVALVLPDGSTSPSPATETTRPVPAADPAPRLVLPPGLRLPGRVEAFGGADRQVFDAFRESDLDDLTGIVDLTGLAGPVGDDAPAEAAPQAVADVEHTGPDAAAATAAAAARATVPGAPIGRRPAPAGPRDRGLADLEESAA